MHTAAVLDFPARAIAHPNHLHLYYAPSLLHGAMANRVAQLVNHLSPPRTYTDSDNMSVSAGMCVLFALLSHSMVTSHLALASRELARGPPRPA